MTDNLSWTSNPNSFSQRFDNDPLPESMKLEYLSGEARTALFNVIYDIVSASGNWGWQENLPRPRMCRRAIASCLGKNMRSIDGTRDGLFDQLQSAIDDSPFNKVFDLLGYIANYPVDQNSKDSARLSMELKRFPRDINNAFDRYGVAYLFDISKQPFEIFPRNSEAQGIAIQNSVATLKNNGLSAPVTHLRDAASHLDNGEHADAIADSIHAVESVARFFDSERNQTLGPAIDSLLQKGVLKHPALASAIKSLYGYTSDEEGIRHALVFGDKANVDMKEAMFMFGACASLAAYLANVCREIGIQDVTGV